jgi:hypothetical protein
MAAPTKARKEEQDPYLMAAQTAIDSAPSMGKRGTYFKTIPNVPFFNPERGRTYRLLILAYTCGKGSKPPLEPGRLSVCKQLVTHAQVGPNGITVLCSQGMFGRKCAQCEEFMRIKNTYSGRMPKDAYAAISSMRPKFREARLIHDLDGAKDNLQCWEESAFLFGDHLNGIVAPRPSYKLYAHPTQGMIVEVTGKEKPVGTGSCTDFASIVMTSFSKAVGLTEMPPKLVERARKIVLDDYVIEMPYATLQSLVKGGVGGTNAQDSNGQTAQEVEPDAEPDSNGTIVEETEEPAPEAEEPVAADEEPAPDVEEEPSEVVEEEPSEVVEEEPVVVEEEPEPEPSIEVDSEVTFKLQGKQTKAKVKTLDGETATVTAGKKTYKVRLKDLTLA